jgi:fermentation-respiration switch protein FrsA (DUF1100 family)
MANIEPVEFKAGGTTLRGDVRRPANSAGKLCPAVVLTHGLSGVKEFCEPYASALTAAGFITLSYDHFGFGASDGEPRLEIDCWRQAWDQLDAVTFIRGLDGVDPERVGLWGTSLSGGHAIVGGALDKRLKAVVAQVPAMSGWGSMRRLVRPDLLAGLRAKFDADRVARMAGAEPALVPVGSADPTGDAVLPSKGTWDYLQFAQETAPEWRNEVTLRSVENLFCYEPAAFIDRIGPTPLLMVLASEDEDCPTDEQLAAYNKALEPKKVVIVDGDHYSVYGERHFETTKNAAVDWFSTHLGTEAIPISKAA